MDDFWWVPETSVEQYQNRIFRFGAGIATFRLNSVAHAPFAPSHNRSLRRSATEGFVFWTRVIVDALRDNKAVCRGAESSSSAAHVCIPDDDAF